MQYRLLFCKFNLMVEDNVRRLERIIHEAGPLGYNGVILDDYKLQILAELDPCYFRNLEQLKKTASKFGMGLYPLVGRFGYANGVLSHNPNMAEGVPVVRAPFQARNGMARLMADPLISPEVDEVVSVKPFRQYHLSVDVKTQNFGASKPGPAVVMPDGRRVGYFDQLPAATQDWSTHHLVFNSADNKQLEIRPRSWVSGSGDYAVKNARLQEVGLVNVIRRQGAPLIVTSADQKIIYEEGRDFEIENNRPLGLMPRYGAFDAYHEPPRLLLSATSRIHDGQTVLVSYYHVMIVREGGVMCCLSEPALDDLVKDQIARVNDIFHPKAFFLGIDEVRVANWCESCRRRSMTPGQLLADKARLFTQMARAANRSADVFAWSDMFDPFHNAHNHYYLANGDFTGSWEGLDKDVIIGAWNFAARNQSLAFFASRGHRLMITGFFDRGRNEIMEWGKTIAGMPGIAGAAYITWGEDYSQLGYFAEVMWNRTNS